MKDILIEKGVPIAGRQDRGECASVAKRMQVGDSVLVADRKTANRIITALHKLDASARSFAVDGGVRVWRVK